MKRLVYLISVAVFGIAISSCSNQNSNKATTGEAQEVSITEGDQNLEIDSTQSVIEWEGSKPTGKHNGTIEISTGKILVTDGKLVGGSFVIDMKSIKNYDLTDAESNAKLVGHLKSADFFDVEKYPTSKFEITSVQEASGTENYNVTGNLTMKEKTASVTFPVKFALSDSLLVVESPQFVIDRSVWEVRYGSRKFFDNLRDNYISDDIALKLKINADL